MDVKMKNIAKSEVLTLKEQVEMRRNGACLSGSIWLAWQD